MIDKVPMEDRDTKGDLYEYMRDKIASAEQNGQFRTPRHIIRLMVEMVEPLSLLTLYAIRPAERADSSWLWVNLAHAASRSAYQGQAAAAFPSWPVSRL